MFQNYIVESEFASCTFKGVGTKLSALHRSATVKKKPSRKLADEVADESRSTQITVAADMVFSLSKNLSGVSGSGRLRHIWRV